MLFGGIKLIIDMGSGSFQIIPIEINSKNIIIKI